MPALRSLVERHADDPFQLIGINEGDDEESFTAGMREHRVNWLVAFQNTGMRTGPITEFYRVQAFPTIYVIDAEGVIRHMNVRGAALDRAVERLLAEMEEDEESEEGPDDRPEGEEPPVEDGPGR